MIADPTSKLNGTLNLNKTDLGDRPCTSSNVKPETIASKLCNDSPAKTNGKPPKCHTAGMGKHGKILAGIPRTMSEKEEELVRRADGKKTLHGDKENTSGICRTET